MPITPIVIRSLAAVSPSRPNALAGTIAGNAKTPAAAMEHLRNSRRDFGWQTIFSLGMKAPDGLV
jgi:hypothetical protein